MSRVPRAWAGSRPWAQRLSGGRQPLEEGLQRHPVAPASLQDQLNCRLVAEKRRALCVLGGSSSFMVGWSAFEIIANLQLMALRRPVEGA